jgi:hypothetical protein
MAQATAPILDSLPAVGLLAALFLKDRAHEARLAVTDVAEANVA